jgi:FtsP/CotA-like multicopper oxidase with cupredoxin domain
MSRNQRIRLLVAAAVVAVVAIVVAVASGGSDDNGGQAAQTNTTTQGQTGTTNGGGTDADANEQPHETVPPKPAVNRIRIEDGEVVGGPADIQVKKGDQVTIMVSANAPDDVHLHGYDIEKPVAPGKPATFKFTADIEGIFEIESHKAEDEGRDPLLGKLTVEPS